MKKLIAVLTVFMAFFATAQVANAQGLSIYTGPGGISVQVGGHRHYNDRHFRDYRYRDYRDYRGYRDDYRYRDPRFYRPQPAPMVRYYYDGAGREYYFDRYGYRTYTGRYQPRQPYYGPGCGGCRY